MVLPELLPKLEEAGKMANTLGYRIHVNSGLRSTQHQLQLACPKILAGTFDPKFIAWPGGSNHGRGVAVDLALYDKKTGKKISGTSSKTQSQEQYRKGNALLADIMHKNGWQRLKSEAWHFEYHKDGKVSSSRTTTVSRPSNCKN